MSKTLPDRLTRERPVPGQFSGGVTFLHQPDPPVMAPHTYPLDGVRPRHFRSRLGPPVYGIFDLFAVGMMSFCAGMVTLRILMSLWG